MVFRLLIVAICIVILPACGESIPSKHEVAGAVARAGYFGDLPGHYNSEVFALHPEIDSLVVSVSCTPMPENGVPTASCVTHFRNAGTDHLLLAQCCGGGGCCEWNLMEDFDDPNIPKIVPTATSPVELRQKMNDRRDLAVRHADEMNNGEQQALEEIRGFYRRLSAQERTWAGPVVAEWIESDDARLRSEALDLVDQFLIHDAAGALNTLEGRLSLTDSDTALIELIALRRIRAHLNSGPETICILGSNYSTDEPISSNTYDYIVHSALVQFFHDNPWGILHTAGFYNSGEGKIAIEMSGDCVSARRLLLSRFRAIVSATQAPEIAQQIRELNERWHEISPEQYRWGHF